MAQRKTKRKLTRKQVAAIKRHLIRTRGKLPPVGGCRVIGGKVPVGSTIHHGVATVCRRGRNHWELL